MSQKNYGPVMELGWWLLILGLCIATTVAWS